MKWELAEDVGSNGTPIWTNQLKGEYYQETCEQHGCRKETLLGLNRLYQQLFRHQVD